jgi:hypothetical protein
VRLVAALVAIEALVAVPAAVVTAVTAGHLVVIGRQEYFVPSSLGVPFAVRVIAAARAEVIALIACLVAAEAAYAVASRVVLRRAVPRHAVPGAQEAAPSPAPVPARRTRRLIAAQVVRLPATWLASWFVTAVFVIPGVLLVAGAWGLVQGTVSGRGMPGTVAGVAGDAAVFAIFVTCLGLALAAAGASSAIRAVLWTLVTRSRGGA